MLTTTQLKSYFTNRYYIGLALVLGSLFSLLVDLAVIPLAFIMNPIGSLIIMVASWVAGLFFIDLLAPATGVVSDGHYGYKYRPLSQLGMASRKALQKAAIVSIAIGVVAYLLENYYFMSPLPQFTRFILNSLFIGMLGVAITSVVVIFRTR